MARTKPASRAARQGEPPAGSLSADDLQLWMKSSKSKLGAAGITANFGRAPSTGGAPGSTWVSMRSARAHGRLVRSPDGATVVTAHALPAGAPLLEERHAHTTIAQLDAITAALGAPPPATGRA